MGIDTHEVLDATSTKWNFSKFTPGLVGRHQVDVDPCYRTNPRVWNVILRLFSVGQNVNDKVGDKK